MTWPSRRALQPWGTSITRPKRPVPNIMRTVPAMASVREAVVRLFGLQLFLVALALGLVGLAGGVLELLFDVFHHLAFPWPCGQSSWRILCFLFLSRSWMRRSRARRCVGSPPALTLRPRSRREIFSICGSSSVFLHMLLLYHPGVDVILKHIL